MKNDKQLLSHIKFQFRVQHPDLEECWQEGYEMAEENFKEENNPYKDLNVYAYEYLWSPIKFVGFIAQEVEKLYPHAVIERDGYKTVNYGAV